jgi:hypothetical protein
LWWIGVLVLSVSPEKRFQKKTELYLHHCFVLTNTLLWSCFVNSVNSTLILTLALFQNLEFCRI